MTNKTNQLNYFSQLTEREFLLVGRVIFLLWLVKIVLFKTWLGALYPEELIIPTGLLLLFNNEILSYAFSSVGLKIFKLTTLLVIITFLIKIKNPWIGIVTVALLLVYSNIIHSFGNYANHAEVALLASAVIFVFAVIFDRYKENQEDCILLFFSLSAMTLAVCYSLIGIYRVTQSGLGLFISDYLLLTIAERSIQRTGHEFQIGLDFLYYSLFKDIMNFGFAVTTFFEILSPIALVYNYFRRVWLVVMIPFHFSTLIFMNIFFWENILLILLLFTSLPGLMAYRLPNWLSRTY